jgi:phosphatidate cytidylyltransferase
MTRSRNIRAGTADSGGCRDDHPAPAPAPARPSKAIIFARRLLTTLVLWSVILGALFSGNSILSNTIFLIIMVALAILGLAEFYGLVARCQLAAFPRWGIFGGVLLMTGTFLHLTGRLGISGTPARVNDFETGFLILFVLGLVLRQLCARNDPRGLQAIALTLFGLMYVPYLLNFIQKINFFPGLNGAMYLLYFILVTKCSDTGAYAVGSLFGKHKMSPRISPGKTWEGFAGAVLLSSGVSVFFAHLAGQRLAGMTPLHALVLGAILSLGAVLGDLIESAFKREAGVKDSGRFFPGIGGILDLLDSLLFNAPLMYLYLRHVLTNPRFNFVPPGGQ